MNEAAPQSMSSTGAIPEDKEPMKMQMDLQRRFPIFHVCPKCLAALLCGSGIRKNVATSLQVSEEVRVTLVDCNVGISTTNRFSIQKILRIVHTIYFILQFLCSA